MRAIALERASEIYVCCDEQIVDTRVVQHAVAKTFGLKLLRLERKLGKISEDIYWVTLLKPLARFRFKIASLPLPFNSPLCISEGLERAVHETAPKCRLIYPDYFDDVMQVVEAAAQLMACKDAPLADTLRKVLDEDDIDGRKSVLIRGGVAALLSNELRPMLGNHSLEVLTPSALLMSNVFNHLLPIGPFSWFPDYIRSAPRSHKLTCIRYDWQADNRPLVPSFVTSESKNTFQRSHAIQGYSEVPQNPDITVSPNDIAPPTDWNAINAEISRREENHLDTVEVPARLLLLSGNVAVYVDVTTDAKSQVIEFNGAGADRIERVPTNEIRQGMYILLRTGGGGDLVAPVADKILGERAQDVRFIQKQWKSALSTLVRDEGEDVVLRNLRELGCKRASHLNLRNWINDRNIRPEFDDDFLSILILCGLDDEDELYVSNARLLDRVHRRAGFQIRRMLLDKVGKADLGCLVSEGSMEFELSGEAGGSFTAYRIEEISPETFPTSVTRLNQLFDAETGYG